MLSARLEELERRTHVGYKDDVKPVRDWPAASASVMTGLQLPPVAAAAARDLPLAELQRLYGPSFLPPVSGLGGVPPQAWYQSPDLAAELLQRERQHLEQLGKQTCTQPVSTTASFSRYLIVSAFVSLFCYILHKKIFRILVPQDFIA